MSTDHHQHHLTDVVADTNHHHGHHQMTMITSTPMPPLSTISDMFANDDDNGGGHSLGHHDHLHQHHGSMMTTGSMDHMGKMYFHFGYEPIVLFEQWSADSNLSLLMTCIFFFFMAIIYEILKAYRRIFSARVIHYALPAQHNRIASLNTTINGLSVQISTTTQQENNEEDDYNRAEHLVKMKSDKLETQLNSSSKMAKFSHPSYGMCSKTAADTESGGSSNQSCGHLSSVNPIISNEHSNHDNNINNTTTIPLFASIHEMLSTLNIYSTFLYTLQVLFAYYLMLAFMLFNIWICLAIIAGAAVGHFVLAEQNLTLSDHNVEDYCH